MKMNRLPLGLGVFNSEINPPTGGALPGFFSPVLLGGWRLATCHSAVVDDDLIKPPLQTRGRLRAPRWLEKFAATSAPALVSNKLDQLKSAERTYSKFMFPCKQMVASACAKQEHQSPGSEFRGC